MRPCRPCAAGPGRGRRLLLPCGRHGTARPRPPESPAGRGRPRTPVRSPGPRPPCAISCRALECSARLIWPAAGREGSWPPPRNDSEPPSSSRRLLPYCTLPRLRRGFLLAAFPKSGATRTHQAPSTPWGGSVSMAVCVSSLM